MRKLTLVLFSFLLFRAISAQNTDTARVATIDFPKILPKSNATYTFKELYIPSSLILLGLTINGNREEGIKKEIVEERNFHIPNFHTHIDNYLQYSPIAIAYGLDALGIKSKTDFQNRTAILIKGELAMTLTTVFLKHITHIERPNKANYQSFPSGHTAQAFAAAVFLCEEYKDKYKWMPYASFGIASTVGVLRMANNKHYLSDVLVGAGLGYLSMKAAYWTHQYKWGRKHTSKHSF